MEAGELEAEKHVRFILTVEKRNNDFVALAMEHLRMNGAYWGLTTLNLLHQLDAVDTDEVLYWVLECQHDLVASLGILGMILMYCTHSDVLDADMVSNCIRQLS